MSKLLWEPDQETIENSNMMSFIKFVNDNFDQSIENYNELHDWSIENVEDFWVSIWEFTNVIYDEEYTDVVENLEAFPPKTNWFNGATLNFAENLLRYNDDNEAILFKGETKEPTSMTYSELYKKVAEVASSLKSMGIGKGDRVVAYMPNIPETVIAMLAATSLGATWSSCGAELQPDAALDRLGQVKPTVMFSVNGYWYKGKTYDQTEKIEFLSENIDSLEKVVVVPFTENEIEISKIENGVMYDEFIDHDVDTIEFEQVSFSQPLYIMFSSGTTGKPKCMVQSVGGILLNHLKELILHTNISRNDKMLYLTSPSWMMWNWTVSQLAVGSTLVLYEGNPLYPDWKELWKFIADYNITVFGCSASYLHHLKTIGAQPGKEFDLSDLKQISQTGSALSEEGFEYVYSEIKEDLHFNSISGGTDINGCFAAGAPILPVYSGELQAKALGMSVKAYDLDGNPIYDDQGELVCELPSPSMPIYFWEDEGNERYQSAYFDFYEDLNVWRHGDYVTINSETGGVKFHGRSDTVLMPSGVRIGTAEIYNIVEQLPEIKDSLAIGQDWKQDQRIILFVNLEDEIELTEELKEKINNELRSRASPRHAPDLIFECPDIPYTFSGKKVESAVTNIINGEEVTNRGALENPESLDYYHEIAKKLQN